MDKSKRATTAAIAGVLALSLAESLGKPLLASQAWKNARASPKWVKMTVAPVSTPVLGKQRLTQTLKNGFMYPKVPAPKS